MEKEKFSKFVEQSLCWSDLCRFTGQPINGTGLKRLRDLVNKYGLNVDHFDGKRIGAEKQRKWKRIKKKCPVCDTLFETSEGHPREQTTCSHSCSNTFFRKGMEYNTSQRKSYRSICFVHHDKKCVVCGEERIVAVHHYDENKENNSPENLIPLCPTHHSYWHSKYQKLIREDVESYRKRFLKNE